MAERVLVIDDEPELVHLIAIFLGTAGLEVYSAQDGQQALALLEQSQPDLVICDMVMPTLDGVATVEAIRSHPKFSDLPIIMLSARGQSDDVERALAAGANDYITKPFRGSEVVATVKRHLLENSRKHFVAIH
jgi:DNA-binding response OmpR family regulator